MQNMLEKFEKGRKEKLSFRFVPTRRVTENYKKKRKKLKKLKNTIMASFHAKVSWKSPSKGENKNFRSISFLPDE